MVYATHLMSRSVQIADGREKETMSQNLVEIENLCVSFYQEGKLIPVVNDVSFEIRQGETLGLVGESGSGKSITAKAIMRLIPDPPGKITGGKILYKGNDNLKLGSKAIREIRGKSISMIFQEPMTSLNPLYTCGDQISEVLLAHCNVTKKEAREKAIEMLSLVGVPLPEKRVDAYPHEFSGGMRQRVMIAMALTCNPDLLIADEPTTALDPTIQAQILLLITKLKKKIGMSVLLITHDLGIVAENCDRVAVMYGGRLVEIADIKKLYTRPTHPYTKGLLLSIPKLHERVEKLYCIDGCVPRFSEMPKGCSFAERCPYVGRSCREIFPELLEIESGHMVRCLKANEFAS